MAVGATQMKFWYRAEVEVISLKHGLDPNVVQAVCMIESSGLTHAYRFEPKFWERYCKNNPEWRHENPHRVSASYGLMQVMFPTAVELKALDRTEAPENLFIPIVGINAGCIVLVDRLRWAKQNLRSALAAYNGGKTLNNAPTASPLRNGDYADKVLRVLRDVEKEHQ